MHTPEELAAMLRALKGHLEAVRVPGFNDAVAVDIEARGEQPDGWYTTKRGMPHVVVNTDAGAAHEPNRYRLVTLAHEGGHVASHERGFRTPSLIAATERSDAGKLRSSDFEPLVREECRAWHLGWELLEAVGFEDHDEWDRRRREGLKAYCDTYGRPPEAWRLFWSDAVGDLGG